jgi:DNA repair ATPase RecN
MEKENRECRINLSSIEKFLKKKESLRSYYEQLQKDETALLQIKKTKADHLQEAQKIIQGISEQIQKKAHLQISAIVTRCLQTVFQDSDYKFQIKFEQKRGKTEANLIFSKNGMEVDPMTASGGGVVDVAAFALRIACLVLSLPKKRKFLVLDEPFRFLSKDYQPAIQELLMALSQELGIQILMVTHSDLLACGKILEFPVR